MHLSQLMAIFFSPKLGNAAILDKGNFSGVITIIDQIAILTPQLNPAASNRLPNEINPALQYWNRNQNDGYRSASPV